MSSSGLTMCGTNQFLTIAVALALMLILARGRNALKVEILNTVLGEDGEEALEPVPTPWPEQFHALLVMNNTNKPGLQVVDLWYDWPNGRNLNLIQNQLGKRLHDVEWDNGTSYYYTLGVGDDGGSECRVMYFPVGILRPNWLDGATYLGQSYVDGFLCNVWEKVDFIWYYEDVVTKRPVHWLFFTGMSANVMTFEVDAVLEDSEWQAPVYCFEKQSERHDTPELANLSRPPVLFV